MADQDQGFVNDTSPEDMKKMWEIIYLKIRRAIENKNTFCVMFTLGLPEVPWEDKYSMIIIHNEYIPLLKSYLSLCEENEEYETCSDIKETIEKYKIWDPQV
jgi:hypothetical protein